MTYLKPHVQSARRGTELRSLAMAFLLIAILALGASLRLVGIDWDQGHLLHPDERFLSMVASAMRPAASVQEYFDTLHSPLNPNNVGYGFYVYGDLPVILVRYLGERVGLVSLYDIYLLGRYVSTAADLLTILTLFFVGRHLFDHRIGLLAAALYAACAFPIQQSHFFTVDTLTTLFVTAAFFFAARALTAHRWIDYPLFGLMLGLAMSSKVSVFPLALILMLALAARVWREDHLIHPPTLSEVDLTEHRPWLNPALLRAVTGLGIAGIVTVLVFRVGQPYAFLPPNSDYPYVSTEETFPGQPADIVPVDPSVLVISRLLNPVGFRPNPLWLEDMAEVRRQVSGYSDIPPNHQWGKRLPLIFPWVNMVRVGMGWPLGVWCWLAFAWAIWEITRRHPRSERLLLPAAWAGMFFTWQGTGWVKTMRYFLPIYPFLILLGAWALVTIWDRIQTLLASRGAPRWHGSAKAALGLGTVVILGAFAWGFAVSRIYTRPMTRIAASEWMLENIPSDVTLHMETAEGLRLFQVGLRNNWLPPGQAVDDPTRPGVQYTYLPDGIAQPFEFRPTFSGEVSSLRLNHVVDPEENAALKTLRVMLSTSPNEAGVLAEAEVASAFAPTDDPRGDAYEVAIPPVPLEADRSYYLILQPIGGPLLLSGSAVTTEGDWDDALPVPTSPYLIWDAQFQGYEMQMAWEDTTDKRARMQYILDHTDYIAISSNRFYASLSRNPQRFPLSIAYYAALFSGDLGFELVGDFTSRPNLGPIEFYDDTAEEAWTVYDHPRVFIFRKTESYDPAHTAEVLGAVDVDGAVRVIAKDAKGWPVSIPLPVMRAANSNLLVDPTTAASDVPPPGLYRSFQPLAVVLWYVLILLLGWITFPALFVALPGLPDRGYGISRVFGMLFAAWLAWLLASINALAWSRGSILLAMLAVATLSAVLIAPRRAGFRAWLRDHRRHVARVEMIIAILFLFFLLVRLGNPDLWHPAYGGEKPMDMSYFNAVLKSRTFPPYDPWFEGGRINYYYFGFVIVGAPVKLLGLPVTLAYNLILPTLFALTGAAAFSAAYNLLAPFDALIPGPAESDRAPTLWETLRAWPRVSLRDVFDALTQGLAPSSGYAATRYVPCLAGVAALLLTLVLGNLDQIRTIIWGLAELGSGVPAYATTLLPPAADVVRGLSITFTTNQPIPVGLGEWYWNATRIIPVPLNDQGYPLEVGPITEFPFFTFLYADLHAHMIALPLTLLAINWCIAQVRGATRSEAVSGPRWGWLLNGFVGGLAIGALRPTNTWDWPTYLALGIGALALAHTARRHDRSALTALGIGAVLGLLFAAGVYFLNGPLNTASGAALGPAILLLAGGAGIVGLIAGFAFGLAVTRHRVPAGGESGPADTPDLLSSKDQRSQLLYSWGTFLGILAQAAGLAGLTFLCFLPYIMTYRQAYTSAIPWTGSRTPLWAYLDILGLFLFVIATWMVAESFDWWHAAREPGHPIRRTLVPPLGAATCTSSQWVRSAVRRRTLASLFLGAILVLALAGRIASAGYGVVLVALPLIAWALALFLRPDQPIEKRAVLSMLAVALALTVVVEVVVLEGDISRMNTVFKFYNQVWILLAITAGAALGWLWPALGRARAAIRIPWSAALAILVFLAALYPFLATRAKVEDRWAPETPLTLDGMAFMSYAERYENGAVFTLQGDYNALRWLQENVQGTPVVLEAQTVEYNWGSRVAVYTGLPTVIGWNWHQRQQRPDQSAEVWQRVTDVVEAYNTTDVRHAMSLLRQYNVELVIVGDLERAYYNAEGLAKFDAMAQQGLLALVYERGGTKIYQVLYDQEATS